MVATIPAKDTIRCSIPPNGRPVVSWEAGASYNLTISGTAHHDGGSCQVSLSYDRGQSWTAIHTYMGTCPLKPNWSFVLPSDSPAGEALLAWSWFNKIGNREMYMNCAHISITPAGNSSTSPKIPFHQRPAMFAANVGNGWGTLEGYDVDIPNPGPNVDHLSNNLASPVSSGSALPNTVSRPAVQSKASRTQATWETSTSSPASISATSEPGRAAKLWEQCGGRLWKGPAVCENGLKCSRQNDWYSQCVPGTAEPTKSNSGPSTRVAAVSTTVAAVSTTSDIAATSTASADTRGFAELWGQCGGRTWSGPTACKQGLVCNAQSEWYSQCVPSAQVWQ